MPTVVQFRRGTTAQNNSFTGAAGEISVDTTLGTIRVHDGSTAGGATIVNATSAQTLTNKTIPYIPGATVIGGTGNLVANASTSSTSITTGALIVPNGGVGIAGNLYIGTNAVIAGNLTVQGNTVSISSSTLSIQDPIISLNTPSDLTPLTTVTTADIGIKFHYYDTSDQHAFLGRAVDTGYLEWYARGNDTANVFTGTVYGTVKSGGLVLSNTTTSTSTTTGALQVAGGVGIAGNTYIGNNLVLGTVPILCSSSVTSTIATAPQAIDWFGSSVYRTGKYVVSTTDVTNSWYQSVEIILVQDGTTSTITSYGLISTSGNTRMTFTSNIMAGNVILWATGVSANNTVKLDKKLIPV